jgi:hypothetical protein
VVNGVLMRPLGALPGAERVALSSQIPMGGFQRPLFVETDAEGRDGGTRPTMHLFEVSPGYFSTMDIPMVAVGPSPRPIEPVPSRSPSSAGRRRDVLERTERGRRQKSDWRPACRG